MSNGRCPELCSTVRTISTTSELLERTCKVAAGVLSARLMDWTTGTRDFKTLVASEHCAEIFVDWFCDNH